MIIDQLPLRSSPALGDETVTEYGTTLYKTTWTAIKNLFNANTSPSDIGAASTANVQFAFFDSVDDLGLTVGSATIAGAVTALTAKNSGRATLRCPASNFASAQLPPVTNPIGTVEISLVGSGSYADIRFYSRLSSAEDWRMYTDASGSPTGTWLRVLTGPQFQIKSYSKSITVSANSGLTVSASDLSISEITGYSPVAIVGITTGNAGILIRSFNAAVTGNVCFVRNVTGSEASGTLTFYMLFARSDMIST